MAPIVLSAQDMAELLTQLVSLRELKKLEFAEHARDALGRDPDQALSSFNLVHIGDYIDRSIRQWDATPLGMLLSRIEAQLRHDVS